MRQFILSASILFAGLAQAWEVDNITCRFRTLKDSLPIINKEVNARIARVLKGEGPKEQGPLFSLPPSSTKRVEESSGCSRDVIRQLGSAIASDWMGNMETWAEESSEVDKCKSSPPPPTVYGKTSKWDLGVASLVGLGSSIRMGEYHIGVDKLSHFMTEGFEYFEKFQELGGDLNLPANRIPLDQLRAVHAQGEREESGGYGLQATGIYSHADTMANFQGFFFWKQVLDGPNPYLKCENGKWVQKREFNWQDFLNHGFDEGINCNRYVAPRMQDAVNQSIREITAKHNYHQAEACPLDPGKCRELLQTYEPRGMLEYILHSTCNNPSHRPSTRNLPADPPILDVPLQQTPETTR